MARVSELIRNDRKLNKSERIKIPVAAVFSKFDTIAPIVKKINQNCTVLDPSPHCKEGAFVMGDWYNVKNEIESLLQKWGATALTQQLDINYSNYSYFAMSALGNSPKADNHIDRPSPHRIEDALLWILKEKGVIESKK
jgi:hypothetical protein